MGKATRHSRGFTLIATLLMLLLLSGIAVGLLFLVNGQGKVGGNDLESNMAYYGAESGMEKLAADLDALYQANQAPTKAQITALTNNPPNTSQVGPMNYQENITWQKDANGNPVTYTSVVSAGPNAGLTAIIVPMTLQVTANRPASASVNMTRGVEVALIPVFQFGVFSESDLSYFPGPMFDFEGRVHTNGNLYLATGGGPLILNAKVTAVGEIIRDRLANNYNNGGYQGDVYVPNVTGGCSPPNATSSPNCLKFTINPNDASWSGSLPPNPPGSANGNWGNISNFTFNGFIGNKKSLGVKPLKLPFVAGAGLGASAAQIQIIHKGLASDTTAMGNSREYNKAQIRVLLANTVADLHPERSAGVLDADDVDLVNTNGGVWAVTGSGGSTSFAQADKTKDANWKSPSGTTLSTWPLVDGWLRVEYKDANGNWHGVTREWLGLGFARQNLVPTTPLTGNTAHPDAILIFQQLADRNGDGSITGADAPSNIINGATSSKNSWYPINLYDPREGFPRDSLAGTGITTFSGCYANGIMNAVELDVGNLRQWLKGNIGASGTSVDFAKENGYILYFSDRRGMNNVPGSNPPATNGEYGFEDVINATSPTGTPDGVLEPVGSTGFSPEDADENGVLDNWGASNVGTGFQVNTNNNPYVQVNCSTIGRANKVFGARHVLKLVDGNLGNLPTRLDNNGGGFTVAAENPVYVQGNYNTNSTDPFWGNPLTTTDIPHAAASILADAVTLLSNNWTELNSMNNASQLSNRNAGNTYYRMAVAGGKHMNFPNWQAGWPADFGTDGGVHNFLRYIETWGGSSLYYRGSLVSLYYAEQATGTFKCCTLVYSPPTRKYYFDFQFLNPSNLPPGTPMFQDVVNLSYWQSFQPY